MILPGVGSNFMFSGVSGAFPEFGSNVASGQNQFDDSHSLSMPSGIVAGDLLIALFTYGNDQSSPPSGWTQHEEELQYTLLTRTAAGGEGSLTITTSGDATFAGNVWRIKAGTWDTSVGGGTGIEYQLSSSQAPTSSVNPPSITPSWGKFKNLYIAGATFRSIPATISFSSHASGYSNGIVRDSFWAATANSVLAASSMLLEEGTTQDPGSISFSSSSNNIYAFGWTIAIKGL